MEKGKEGKRIINIDLEDDENENNTNADGEPDPGANVDVDLDDENDINHTGPENSNIQLDSNTTSTNNKKNKKITRAVKEILTTTKFMSNFDPELSNRERRKLTRKFNAEGQVLTEIPIKKKNASGLDENGSLNGVEKDICDCLSEDCPGCHFPCPKCRSCKCGIECRVNRKWIYEGIENEADMIVARNSSTSTT